MSNGTETVASIRADFMRRWFAIAISVGFATTVVNMPWVRNGVRPDYQQAEQLARLGVALLATVLSWEGYLLSIRNKPLEDIWRYLIDIGLVFLYLFLLLTSGFPHYWLWLHAWSFLIYMIWDFLTILQYREKYSPNIGERKAGVLTVYFNGLISKEKVDRGPVITVFWAGYFWLLYAIYPSGMPYGTFVFAVFVLLGLCGYRLNKGVLRSKGWFTLASVGFLSALASLVSCRF